MKADLKPVVTDSKGPGFDKSEVVKVAVNRINSGEFFAKRESMSAAAEVENAKKKLDKMLDCVDGSITALIESEKSLTAKTKSISGQVKDAAEKLSTGLARVEKAANFDRLERYVELLERAAGAMTILAELEKSGKLEKIASAVR